jgi:hypothetical protein
MKKHIIILFLLGVHLQSHCQPRKIPVNCSDSVLMSIKGRWKKVPDVFAFGSTNPIPRSLFPEIYRRTDFSHQLLVDAYPQPTGVEASWTRILEGEIKLGQDKKYQNGIPFYAYTDVASFPMYTCTAYHPKDVGLDGETPTWYKVYTNNLAALWDRMMLDTSYSINGMPFHMRSPAKETWKGYEVIYIGGHTHAVILTRKGALPYIPVTRKQYLDYCFTYLNNFFEKNIKATREIPVRSLDEQEAEKKAALDKIDADYKNDPKRREANREYFLSGYGTDQRRRDETTNSAIKWRDEQINRYENELKKSREANLLDSPAIVLEPHTVRNDVPIFTTEMEDGKMLVMENPSYIRKDLPKYVPQFLVLAWSWDDFLPEYGGAAGLYFKKMFEANFPIEKLQAMIDR